MRQLLFSLFLVFIAISSSAQKLPATLDTRDINGATHRPFHPGEKLANVLIFFWHDCPISNSYAPEINRLCATYTNISFYIVQVDPDLDEAAAKRHAQEFALTAPILLDPKHRLVKLAGAHTTPEAIIIDKSGKAVYRGRIDDKYVSLTKHRAEPTHRDLRDALDALATGKPIKVKATAAIGCAIQNDK